MSKPSFVVKAPSYREPAMYLVFSTSLNPGSRSRAMAQIAATTFRRLELEHELIDLAQLDLPDCDGDACYQHSAVRSLQERIRNASAVLIASPIYNFDMSSSAKKLIELTGNVWENKIVGFLAAAGGRIVSWRSWALPTV